MAQHLRALLDPDYDVQVVPDGRALMAAVEFYMPDVIISDIAMPGISGLAAARNIRTAHPEARIIFISVLDEPASEKPSRRERPDTSSNPTQAMNWRTPFKRFLAAAVTSLLPRRSR